MTADTSDKSKAKTDDKKQPDKGKKPAEKTTGKTTATKTPAKSSAKPTPKQQKTGQLNQLVLYNNLLLTLFLKAWLRVTVASCICRVL